MNQHQRHLRQAAEQAFAESLTQLEKRLMASEVDPLEPIRQRSPNASSSGAQSLESKTSRFDRSSFQEASSPSADFSDEPSSTAKRAKTNPGHCLEPAKPAHSKTLKERSPQMHDAPTSPGDAEYSTLQEDQNLRSTDSQSTRSQSDSLQAFADAAEDIERFIQAQQ